jgi:hypothetical protein
MVVILNMDLGCLGVLVNCSNCWWFHGVYIFLSG